MGRRSLAAGAHSAEAAAGALLPEWIKDHDVSRASSAPDAVLVQAGRGAGQHLTASSPREKALLSSVVPSPWDKHRGTPGLASQDVGMGRHGQDWLPPAH